MIRYSFGIFSSVANKSRFFSTTTKSKLDSLPATNPELQKSLKEMQKRIGLQFSDQKISSNRKPVDNEKLRKVLEEAEKSHRVFSVYG